LLPLTSDSDRVSHFLASLVDLPLTPEESRVVSERAAVLSQHPRFHGRPQTGATPFGSEALSHQGGGSVHTASGYTSGSTGTSTSIAGTAHAHGNFAPPLLSLFPGGNGAFSPHLSSSISTLTSNSRPTMFPFPAYPGAPVPYSMLFPPGHPQAPPHPQYLGQFPPTFTSAAGMAAPGEVYLSQEALRNNPNAAPRGSHKRQGHHGTK
jgi:hypothetical protein